MFYYMEELNCEKHNFFLVSSSSLSLCFQASPFACGELGFLECVLLSSQRQLQLFLLKYIKLLHPSSYLDILLASLDTGWTNIGENTLSPVFPMLGF